MGNKLAWVIAIAAIGITPFVARYGLSEREKSLNEEARVEELCRGVERNFDVNNNNILETSEAALLARRSGYPKILYPNQRAILSHNRSGPYIEIQTPGNATSERYFFSVQRLETLAQTPVAEKR